MTSGPDDVAAIVALTTAAFRTTPQASGTEAQITDRLRAAGALILSLIAEQDGEMVGHAAFSPAMVGGTGGWFGLGPISVRPDRHRKGIGSILLKAGLDRLRETGALGCVLVGDPAFYGKLGFRSMPGLVCEGVPAENTMALAFGTVMPEGQIAFHPAFFGEI